MRLVLLTMQFCTRNVAAANGATLATGVVQATQHGSNVAKFTQQDQSSDHFATRDVQQCPWANNSQDGAPYAQDNTCSTDAAHQPTTNNLKTDEHDIGIDRSGHEIITECEAAHSRWQAHQPLSVLGMLILGVGTTALVLRARLKRTRLRLQQLKISAAVKVQRAFRYWHNRQVLREIRRYKAAAKIQTATRLWILHNVLVIPLEAALTIQLYFWPRSSAGREAVADAKREAAERREARREAVEEEAMAAEEAAWARDAKDYFLSEGQRLYRARVAADKKKNKKKNKRAGYPPTMPHELDTEDPTHFFNWPTTAGIMYALFPRAHPMADFDTAKLDVLKYNLFASLTEIEGNYRHARYVNGHEMWPPGMTPLNRVMLSRTVAKLAGEYIEIIEHYILIYFTHDVEHEWNFTPFCRLLHMWLNVVATRHDSGEGKLISPAQAWDNPRSKFPDEFLEFSGAIEASITELHYENYVDDEDNDLQCDSTDYSSSDDEFEREMVRRTHASPQNNSSSASCTA